MKNYITCCFCGNTEEGIGNNPWPVNQDENAYCCSRCNQTIVIPARYKRMQEWFESEDFKAQYGGEAE